MAASDGREAIRLLREHSRITCATGDCIMQAEEVTYTSRGLIHMK
jgi:hypothetical protein